MTIAKNPPLLECQRCKTNFTPTRWKQQYCSVSCGSRTSRNRRHGQSQSTEYVSWRDMKRRCLNPSQKDYPGYGGRGIMVSERWMNFDNFIADMGMKPSAHHTIERNDVNGNYEPSNCRWATRLEQARNKRPRATSTLRQTQGKTP